MPRSESRADNMEDGNVSAWADEDAEVRALARQAAREWAGIEALIDSMLVALRTVLDAKPDSPHARGLLEELVEFHVRSTAYLAAVEAIALLVQPARPAHRGTGRPRSAAAGAAGEGLTSATISQGEGETPSTSWTPPCPRCVASTQAHVGLALNRWP